MLERCFLIVSCFFCVEWLCGQEYSYVNYNTREGLAGPMAYCMAQDHDGFMWFGTETGLSRFDGTRFTNFTTADGLPDIDIIKLYVDSKNRVWIIPFRNTICYYWRGKLHNASNDSLLSRLNLISEVIAIKENGRGEIMLTCRGKIFVIKPDETIIEISQFMNNPIGSTFCVGLRKEGNFLVSFSQEKQGFFVGEFVHDSLRLVRRWDTLTSRKYPIYISPKLEINVGEDSIVFFFPETKRERRFAHPPGSLTTSVINDSLIAMNATSTYLYNIAGENAPQVFLKGKNVSSAFLDRENNLWFTTMGEGVYRMPSGQFKNYSCRLGEMTLPVFSLSKKGDVLLAGTSQYQLWTINTRSGAISNESLAERITLGRIMTLNYLPSGALVVGTDHGVYTKRGKAILRSHISFAVKDDYVSGDTILVASSTGIYRVQPYDLRSLDTLWVGRATAMLRKNNLLYVGTLNGLFIRKDGSEPENAGKIHPALAGRISDIREDKNGTIWVATIGYGVIGLQQGKVSAWLRRQDGLTSDVCRVLFSVADTLWVGTELGLNRITRKGNGFDITKYTTADGLVSNTINTILVDGVDVFAGTPMGISYFEQDKVSTQSMCELRVTAIRSSKHTWPFDTTGLAFGHWENDVRFEFSGISFKSAGDITYRYRLRGLSDDWQETNDNFLSYLSLPSGSYELELKAINKFGIESGLVQLRFTIAKLLWEKTWFRLVVILLLAAGIWRYVQYRTQKVRQQEAAKLATGRKITELEQMALKAQMNPHFIFNCLHSIQQFVIDKDTRGANKFITDFARLIRLTLEISAQARISLADEINYISTYLELEKSKYEDSFTYDVTLSPGLDPEIFFIPPMILQPYVENSIRHGIYYRPDNNGKVDLQFRTENNYLVCVIEDNGVGRQASEQLKGEGHGYKSRGMSLIMKRIELLNHNYELPITSDIEDVLDNDEICGTRVIIRFPIEGAKKRTDNDKVSNS